MHAGHTIDMILRRTPLSPFTMLYFIERHDKSDSKYILIFEVSCEGDSNNSWKWLLGPWSNGYKCGMRIPRPGFNSQYVPDHGCWAHLGQVG